MKVVVFGLGVIGSYLAHALCGTPAWDELQERWGDR